MALPPHIIKRKIDAMPDGLEKDKKLKSFNIQMKIMAVVYPIMFLVMAILTLTLIAISVFCFVT